MHLVGAKGNFSETTRMEIKLVLMGHGTTHTESDQAACFFSVRAVIGSAGIIVDGKIGFALPFAAGNVDHAMTSSCGLLVEQPLFIL
jgi:hypothetical protein